jgi:gluconolactonase
MRRSNPLDGYLVNRSSVRFVGRDLQRPECILAEQDGTLWTADARGGVMRISPDGAQSLLAVRYAAGFVEAADDATRYTTGTLPNGLAFGPGGEFLVANFGTDALEVMDRTGNARTLFDSIDGLPIGKVNFVLRDRRDRIWLTISTRTKNWMEAMTPATADGYIALADGSGSLRVVADGFRFTNEIRFDADEKFLYVVETTGQRITRLKVREDGTLYDRETFGPGKLGPGGFPDGIAFDQYGNLWGTLVMADILFVITPDGEYREILVDGEASATLALEQAFRNAALTPDILLSAGGKLAPWFSSVTFGGSDLRTVYIGSLRGTRVPCFRSPVPGLPMRHWQESCAAV